MASVSRDISRVTAACVRVWGCVRAIHRQSPPSYVAASALRMDKRPPIRYRYYTVMAEEGKLEEAYVNSKGEKADASVNLKSSAHCSRPLRAAPALLLRRSGFTIHQAAPRSSTTPAIAMTFVGLVTTTRDMARALRSNCLPGERWRATNAGRLHRKTFNVTAIGKLSTRRQPAITCSTVINQTIPLKLTFLRLLLRRREIPYSATGGIAATSGMLYP